ncbi:hypothetical protein CRX72_27805 [Pantoea sp. BRM17]|nr:hypothetical protein CRX72_27805 [Pantoea sp. BRM17]
MLAALLSWRGHFDPALLHSFVRSIGIYPVGSLVRLASGRVALVVQAGEKSLLKPKLHVFWSLHARREVKPEIAGYDLLDVALHHHEKFDGSGYPHGLRGEEITLYARMASVCDVYDALTSHRPYRKGWTPAEAMHNMLMISLGKKLGLEADRLRRAGMAGLLHDVGKAAVPLAILNKPGKLSDDEFAVMREHPIVGAQMLMEADAQGKPRVLAMFNEARMGQRLDLSFTLDLVDQIAGSIAREPSALLSVARLKNHDDYTYLHSMAVCGLWLKDRRIRNLMLITDRRQIAMIRSEGIRQVWIDLDKSVPIPHSQPVRAPVAESAFFRELDQAQQIFPVKGTSGKMCALPAGSQPHKTPLKIF